VLNKSQIVTLEVLLGAIAEFEHSCKEITMGVSKIMLFTIAILLYLFGCLHGANSQIWEIFSVNDMWGLQSLWQAWKNNTPNIDTNLAFWTSSNNQAFYPCYNAVSNWRGVTCLRSDIPNGNGNQNTWVIGL
jgi:hypothetical protein